MGVTQASVTFVNPNAAGIEHHRCEHAIRVERPDLNPGTQRDGRERLRQIEVVEERRGKGSGVGDARIQQVQEPDRGRHGQVIGIPHENAWRRRRTAWRSGGNRVSGQIQDSCRRDGVDVGERHGVTDVGASDGDDIQRARRRDATGLLQEGADPQCKAGIGAVRQPEPCRWRSSWP